MGCGFNILKSSSLECQFTKGKNPATQQVLFIEPATPIGAGSVLRGPVWALQDRD